MASQTECFDGLMGNCPLVVFSLPLMGVQRCMVYQNSDFGFFLLSNAPNGAITLS